MLPWVTPRPLETDSDRAGSPWSHSRCGSPSTPIPIPSEDLHIPRDDRKGRLPCDSGLDSHLRQTRFGPEGLEAPRFLPYRYRLVDEPAGDGIIRLESDVPARQDMDNSGSVTRWIKTLREGDQEAAARLWSKYFYRLAGVVRSKFGEARLGAADGEDVALSAFFSFCRCIEEGRFGDLSGRDELWRLLVLIAKRKAVDSIRHEMAAKRGGGKVRGEGDLAEVVSPAPTPAFTAELFDEVHRLMDVVLGPEEGMLRLIALRKLEGYSNKEIAAELSLATRTVDRKLELIRILWTTDAEKRAQSEEP